MIINKPLVSVNVTTYNRAHLLPRCLDGILSQSYDNLEVVIVDDFSQDNTAEVIHEYQKNDDRIIYFKHDANMGNAYARNTALENCTGCYVAFMDDDDEWIDKDKITKQVKIFENSRDKKLGIICSSVRIFCDQNNFTDKITRKPKNLISHILSTNGIIYSPTVMTRRDIMIEVGCFDTNLSRGIDSDFYRNCIVRYGYDVFFMTDVTTGIHEYGTSRMTLGKSVETIKYHIDAQLYKYKKYPGQMKEYPRASSVVNKTISHHYLQLLRHEKEIKYLLKVILFLTKSFKYKIIALMRDQK